METIKIAHVNVNKSKIEELDYDTIFDMAKKTPFYRWKRNADELIKAELEKHGIRKEGSVGSEGGEPEAGSDEEGDVKEGTDTGSDQKPVEKRNKTRRNNNRNV